ncbi:MAG: hypothetical protein IPM39_12250 [Chloroflexi bacterium]|nr:hypothetical protein [Chloroflexota bacterium]
MNSPIELRLLLSAPEMDAEKRDNLARQLARDLNDWGLDSVKPIAYAGPLPEGAKGNSAMLQALGLTAVPSRLPSLVNFLHAWALRGQDLQLTIKTPGGLEVTFTPDKRLSPDELVALVQKLQSGDETTNAALPPTMPYDYDRVKLRHLVAAYFDESELQTLCFDLRLDYEELPGKNKSDKVVQLLLRLERRDQIPTLLQHIQAQRPTAPWHEVAAD